MTVPVKDIRSLQEGCYPVLEPVVGVVALELLPDDVANHLVVSVRFVGFQFFQRTLPLVSCLDPKKSSYRPEVVAVIEASVLCLRSMPVG